MRTLKFSDVIHGVAQLAGLDRDNLPSPFFKQVRDLAEQRLRIAWETEYWPSTLRIVERTVTTASDVSSMAYPTDAGEVLEVYSKNPKATTIGKSIGFVLHDDGTDSDTNSGRSVVVYTTTSPLFMEYRTVSPELKGDVYKSTTDYGVGDQAYYTGTGCFYEMTTDASAGTHPANDAGVTNGNWKKIAMPKIFEPYLIRGVFSDYLRSNGQLELASIEDRNAEGMLGIEADKLYRQQGQVRRTSVIGY